MSDFSDYCRQLESHLCQRNGGHLVRIVGPGFERVRGWAEQGVPLTIAKRGIDVYCERYFAKGPKRRPVRIEFCEADILDMFDDWRRAVGVTRGDVSGEVVAPSRKPALSSHLERAIARLVARREAGSAAFEQHLAALVAEIDRLATTAKGARGDARTAIVARLSALDDAMMRAAVDEVDPDALSALRREVDTELAPFASGMSQEKRVTAAAAALVRLVRHRLGLPVVAGE